MSLPRVLILECTDAKNSYYVDWREAFVKNPRIKAEVWDMYALEETYTHLKQHIGEYDFIVALHSSNAMGKNLKFLMAFSNLLQQRRCPFMAFIGNELNFPDPGDRLYDRVAIYKSLQPEFIATQLPGDVAQMIYAKIWKEANVVAVPHALNPDTFFPTMEQKDRPIQLGMRTGKYASWLGDQDRNMIVEYFRDQAGALGIKVDIDNHFMNKLPPAEWAKLLGSCQGTIGNESGGFFMETDDATVSAIRDYVYEKLGLKENSFLARWFQRRLFQSVPGRDYRRLIKLEHYLQRFNLLHYNHIKQQEAYFFYDYEEIYEKFFAGYPNPVSGKCISSRHFDAVGTQTAQILFRGTYNGVLQADEHYFPLENDFSNVGEVIRQFKDDAYRTEMVKRTHAYALDAHTYQHRVNDILDLVFN